MVTSRQLPIDDLNHILSLQLVNLVKRSVYGDCLTNASCWTTGDEDSSDEGAGGAGALGEHLEAMAEHAPEELLDAMAEQALEDAALDDEDQEGNNVGQFQIIHIHRICITLAKGREQLSSTLHTACADLDL